MSWHPSDRHPQLIGRHREIEVLDRLLERARAGEGDALVLWGEPGIGKTALLHHVQLHAGGFVRLHHRGAPSESGLPFAGLHGLLRPIANRIDTLGPVRSRILNEAFDSRDAPSNSLPVADATLALLCGLAEDQPILITVDDGQWLDEPTAACLGIIARRVRTHPVLVALADHSHPAVRSWDGLPEIRVGELDDGSARQLFSVAAPHAHAATVRQAVAEAGGNPLALLELAAGDLDRCEPNLGRVRVGPRLRRAFRSALDALSPPAQVLAVLAAAAELGDRLTMQRACCASGTVEADWDSAVEELTNAGLLHTSANRIGFRHPIVRRAVYESGDAAARRRAHLALAAAMPDDGDERPYHLAAAADGHDEAVAVQLEQAATRSRRRGATAMAAQALQCAAELSPDPIDASQRLAGAARESWDAGWAAAAERLLDDAERLTPGPHVARRSHGLRGVIEIARGIPELAHHHLVSDMAAAPDTDTALTLGTTGMLAGWAAARRDLQSHAAQRLIELDISDRQSLRAALTWWSDDTAATNAPDHNDLVTLARMAPVRLLPPTPLALAWGIEEPVADALLRRLPGLRRRSAGTELALALSETAMLLLFTGPWTEAESAATEGLQLAEDVGAHHLASVCRACLGWLAAARGDMNSLDQLVGQILETSWQGVRALNAAAYWTRGMGLLFEQRPEEALDSLLRLTESSDASAHPTIALLAALDTAEAALQVGRRDVAQDRASSLAAWAQRTGAPWARASAHLSRALLGNSSAEDEFRSALTVSGATTRPLLHARTQLCYGEWLRRGRRRTDARTQLEAACEAFVRLGAEPLLRRAQRELSLTDPPGRRATPAGMMAPTLTAQEQRVARLAAQQLTNREIGTQLRISHRTVGHHLGNVFSKLGIATRSELAHRLEDSRTA